MRLAVRAVRTLIHTMRNLIIIGISVILVVLIALGMWQAFVAPKEEGAGGGRLDFFSALFPFLREQGAGPFPEVPLTPGEGITNQRAPALRQVASEPVSGFGIIARGDETFIQYLDRATGHLYESRIDTLGTDRLTNTTIPRVLEALWVGDNKVMLRYLDDDDRIITFSASTTPSDDGASMDLSGRFLETGISALAVRPDGKKIFYLVPIQGGVLGYESNPDGSGRRAIFESPLKDWVVEWPTASAITLATKASGELNGVAYLLNPSTTVLREVGSTARGLMTRLGKDGTTVLTASGGVSVQTSAFDTQADIYDTFILNTLPEKCASSVQGGWYCGADVLAQQTLLPDSWYQGTFSFSDDIWLVFPMINEALLMEDTRATIPGGLDLINPQLSDDEHYFVFMNKKDLSLWSLRLVEPEEETATSTTPSTE